ncbi:hypothetical protein ACFQ7A_30760 [Streptomyces sp. NPDC056528]|uniref:hypothetical protein n=1 Tax=Streptomyces sp. NPDC056528 TaxID=3345854 RepID=UPI0036A45F71
MPASREGARASFREAGEAELSVAPGLSLLVVVGRMNDGDEQLLHGWVYGAEHDDPAPGSKPGRTYAEFAVGPLDGLLFDIHGWRTVEVDDGVALITELFRWPGGRALYDPHLGEVRKLGPGIACRFYYTGDTP